MILLVLTIVVSIALSAHFLAAFKFERDIRELKARVSMPEDAEAGQRAVAADLPDIIARFVARAGVSTERAPATVHLTQAAELRMAPDKPWAPLDCEQLISIRRPGFVWIASQRRAGFGVMRVVDAFVAGQGFLEARLLGSVPVVRVCGPEVDRSELMRYLAELAWAPDAVLFNPAVRWRAIDSRTAELEADSNGGAARVRLYFSADADIIEMQADERASREKGVMVPRPWRGVFSHHLIMSGRRIPTRAEVGYVYDDGYAAYWRGSITGYELFDMN